LRSLPFVSLLVFLALCCTPAVSSAREKLQVFVTEPYLELHTGAGRGYPVFNVVARDASVQVLFRRTDWFKVRTEKGVEGWASQRDMLKTVLADGTPFTFDLGYLPSVRGRRVPWCLGWRKLRFDVHLVLLQLAARPGAFGRQLPR
jgi:hypothetical protein